MHAPGPSGVLFLFFNLLQLILPEKTTLEKMSKFGALSIKKFLIRLRLRYLRSFLRVDVYLFVLTAVNIQPNSKLHPPTKIFWIHS